MLRARANAPVGLITITVMLGLIMAIIDATIVNVALNNIAGSLGASLDDVAWVSTGYILAAVITMPLNGWLTAFFGRKMFYAGCLAIFTIASLLCGTARSIWLLVFYRVVQGFGGGALQPTAQAILFESYPTEKRGAAMAIFGLGAMVGPAVGPTLGGYIIDNATWPIIFYINIPIGIIAFIMTMLFIPNADHMERPKGGIDWIGLGMMSAGLASLQYLLERGQHDDWYQSPLIWSLTIVAVTGILGFIFREIRDRAPLVDLSVFKHRTFTIGNIIGVVSGFGLFGTSLILPLFLQTVMGMTAFDTGMALLPGAVATAISMVVVGRFTSKIDPRIVVAFGMIVFGISCWWLGGLDQNTGYWDVFYPRLIQGFGLGFLFVPLTTVTLGAVARNELAGATGISALVRQLGGSFGIAILTTLLARETAVAWAALAGGVTHTHGYSVLQLEHVVAVSASVIGYDYLFRLCAIVFFLSVPLVFFMRPSRRSGAPAVIAAE
ncbi:MAG: DHA2 family efflux MFS transporter permease subunit [Candidatus Eremiobacteraeota bacterium]|nr:DHA2 family efflux MFS transporter permease subunit [Candidatus Eremiobacteraeota bacterium]